MVIKIFILFGKTIMDTLSLIVKKMHFRKEQSEFKTYRNASRWAIRNIFSLKVQSFKVQKLEKAY